MAHHVNVSVTVQGKRNETLPDDNRKNVQLNADYLKRTWWYYNH
jgi:hypothetical protein